MSFSVKDWIDGASGPVMLDGSGHYWRLDVSASGIITTTDLGTSAPSSTPISAAALEDMETRLSAYTDLVAGTYVTSLPGSPTDGQVIHYAADATNGVIWQLRYRSGATGSYKWEFIGGPPLIARVDTSQSKSTTGSYGDLTTVGPTVTTPLAGDYDVDIGVFMASSANVANIANASYTIGATAPADADAIQAAWNASASTQGSTGHRRNRATAIAASTALKLQYKLAAAGSTSFAGRWIAITPVRVG